MMPHVLANLFYFFVGIFVGLVAEDCIAIVRAAWRRPKRP